jgi:hypothetical protein
MERGAEKGRCLLCKEEENDEHILSRCKETQKWNENFLNTKWSNTGEEIAYEKITSSANSVDLENLVRVLHQKKKENGKTKWENEWEKLCTV